MPLLETTHDPDCTSEKCLSNKVQRRLFLIGQRASKQMMGYFGGYISKRQKIGRFELKESIAAQPYFRQKLKHKKHNESKQLALVCNRMFSHLEGRGILRSGVEETLLSAEYNKADPLAAEFI